MIRSAPSRRTAASLAALLAAVVLLTGCPPNGGGNRAPTAEAGDAQQVRLGETVTLDASGSSDPDGDPLVFEWRLSSAPQGSAATLDDPNAAEAAFTPDAAGTYTAELTVGDGELTASDSVAIDVAANRAPTAEAGSDRTIDVGTEATLDGSGSSDPDGDTLSYSWELSAPAGSGASLSGAGSATPAFTPDVAGEYRLALVVSDGALDSDPDLVVIDAETTQANRAPTAEAGSDRTVDVGVLVTLDGSGSGDPDGDALNYSWQLVATPSGSGATLANAGSAAATFTPDVAGDYTAELTVDDGSLTDSARVTIGAEAVLPDTTVFVAPDGDDGNTGIETAPVATLQRALAIFEGDPDLRRIRIADGTYRETFGYTFAPESARELVLEGESRAGVVLDAQGAPLLELDGAAALRMRDLTVRATDPAVRVPLGTSVSWNRVDCAAATACILAAGDPVFIFPGAGGDVTVQDSAMEGTGRTTAGTAISLAGNTALLSGVTVRDFDRAIFTYAARFRLGPTVAGVNSEIVNNNDGVFMFFTADGEVADIVDTTIRDNTIGAQFEGATARIAGSTVTGSREHGIVTDVDYNGSSVLELTDTAVTANTLSGVAALGDTDLTVSGGTFNGNGLAASGVDRAGFYLASSSTLFLDGAEVADNGQDNLAFLDSSVGDIANATIHGSSYAGVYARTSGGVTITGSDVHDNYNGFFVRGSSRLETDDVDINDHGGDGINFRGDALTLRRARFQRNSGVNLRLSGSPSSVDLGTASDGGGNIFTNDASTDASIRDERSADSGSIPASGNIYGNGSYSVLTSDLSDRCGPATLDPGGSNPGPFAVIVNSGNCLRF